MSISHHKASKMKAKWVLILTAVISLAALQAFMQKDQPKLIGRWKLVKSESLSPDGNVRVNKHYASLLLFDHNSYFMAWEGGNTPPKASVTPFRPTEKEMLSRYPNLIFNAGKYVRSKTVIGIIPEIALVPEYVGGSGKLDYHFSGDTLKLIWKEITSVDGASDPASKIGFKWRYSWLRAD